MISLRDCQTAFKLNIYRSLDGHRRVTGVAHCGFGKTRVSASICEDLTAQGKNVLFVVHQIKLLTQTSDSFWELGLAHECIRSGSHRSNSPVTLAMIQSLVNRLKKDPNCIPTPDLIIFDECHLSVANSFLELLRFFPNAQVLGLTATPERTDGRGLEEIYEDLVQGPTYHELLELGFLSPYRLYSRAIDGATETKGLKTVKGDYDQRQVSAMMNKPTITGDAIKCWKELCNGKRTVIMCADSEHARSLCESYNAAGIPSEVMLGTLDELERNDVFDRFTRGETLCLMTVQLLVVGVDIPLIEAVQWLVLTCSRSKWEQANGRALRIHPDKELAVILDHCGNQERMGPPGYFTDWTLEAKAKKPKKEKPKERYIDCPKCYKTYLFRPSITDCPYCKTPIVTRMRGDIEVIDGELVEADIPKLKAELEKRRKACRDLRALVIECYAQGIENPGKYAAYRIANREGKKKPHIYMLMEAEKILKELTGGRNTDPKQN